MTSKEEPQVLKVKLLDDSHLNMPIFFHGNIKEYLAHIIAVLCIIKQKGLDAKHRKLGKAVVRQSEMLKKLLETAGSKDTVSLVLKFRPARWRLSRPNRCSKIPRRLTTRQWPRHLSS
jgi:hypothetical protein